MRASAALALFLATACGGQQVPAPSLVGTWSADYDRIDELYVVSSTPEGPERDRIRQSVARDLEHLQIEFTDDEATLQTAMSTRTVPYKLLRYHGPMVTLESTQMDRPVFTSLRVHGDSMTWFDSQGEVEFVLRRR